MRFHYATPGLTWDCGFKYTRKKIELLQDVDMLLMFENMIRGGFSGTLGKSTLKQIINIYPIMIILKNQII